MKKKTFIVQLLDSKKPNRKSFTQVEDANFYSNDTDASLVFIPHEDAFDFQTAKVVMYNRSDESLVERDAVVTTENGRKVASYELPDEIIAHWGDWTAQPVFISDGEIYSGSIVPFSVFRYLMHERPPKLSEIVTVSKFLEQSQQAFDEMSESESDRVLAEAQRQTDVSQAITIINTTNQSAQQAEAQRVSAESSRVSAEEQRKIDQANRSAELNGKADKIVLKNLVENGDFSDGLTGWSNRSVLANASGITEDLDTNDYVTAPNSVKWTLNGSNLRYRWDINNGSAGDMFYARVSTKKDVSFMITFYEFATNKNILSSPFIPDSNQWVSTSLIGKSTSNGISFGLLNGTGVTGTVNFDDLMVINLTQTFGAGNEPTKEEMDELIKVTGYIDGEYALNNKEMLIWTLALIRRNKNAIVALGGA